MQTLATLFSHSRAVGGLLVACTIFALFATLPISRVSAAPLPASGQFDETTTISAPRLTVRIVKSITFKGNNYRIDSTRPDLVPYSRIKDNGITYSYLPGDQTAMREVSDDKAVSLPDELLAQEKQFITGATKSGTDTVAGFPCDTYSEPLQDNGDTTVHIWVSKDPKFPFVVKTQTVHRKENVTDTEEIDNVRLNALISDTAFALPKDTKMVDAPADGQSPDSGAGSGPAPTGAAPIGGTVPSGSGPTGAAPGGTGDQPGAH